MKLKDISIKDFKQINKAIKQWQTDKNDLKFEQAIINVLNLNHLPMIETSKIVNELLISLNEDINDASLSDICIYKCQKLVDFNKFPIGRFIDADNYYNEPNTITNFMVAVYDDGDKYEGTTEKEKYWEDVSCVYFLYAKSKFNAYKESCVERFKYLYTKTEEDEQQLNGNFKIGGGEEDFQNEFGWYTMLYTYAKEQYMSIRQVEENVTADEFLQFMNFFKRKCELDAIRIKNGY